MTSAMFLTETDRTRLRKLQDKFLELPSVVKHREEVGSMGRPFAGYQESPTYAQIDILIFPTFERDFQAFVKQGK
jgi:hypothetical protein